MPLRETHTYARRAKKERNGVRQDPATIPELAQLNREIERDRGFWLSGCRVYACITNGVDLSVVEFGNVRRFSYVNGTRTNQVARFDVPHIGVREISLPPYGQRLVDEPLPRVPVVRIVPSVELPGSNLLSGVNADFSLGLSGWSGEGTNDTVVVSDASGRKHLRATTRKDIYRHLPDGTYNPGDRLVCVCRAKADEAVDGRAGMGKPKGAGMTLSIWSQDWKRMMDLHARIGSTGGEWKTIVGTAAEIPEWVSSHNELHVGLRKTEGCCELKDLGLYKASVSALVYVHIPKGVTRVRVVDEMGNEEYDSGVLPEATSSFVRQVSLFSPVSHRLVVMGRDGTCYCEQLICRWP